MCRTCDDCTAHADTGVGVDTWRANKLDPTAGAAVAGHRRARHVMADARRAPLADRQSLHVPGRAARGFRARRVDLVRRARDRRRRDRRRRQQRALEPLRDWDSRPVLGLLDYTWERPDDGTYANVRASRISDDDEYYQAVFGRAGSYKIQAFLREVPNVLTNNARPIWNGVGTNNLTLPAGLTPGGSTPARSRRGVGGDAGAHALGQARQAGPRLLDVPDAAVDRVRERHRRGTQRRAAVRRHVLLQLSVPGQRRRSRDDQADRRFDDQFQRRLPLRGRCLAHGFRLSGLVLSRPLSQLQLRVAVLAVAGRRRRDVRAAVSRARWRWSPTTTTTICARRSRASCR